MTAKQSRRVALFVDAENVVGAFQDDAQPLVDLAKEEGALVFARAYGDWTMPGLNKIMGRLQEVGFHLEQLCSSRKGKNTADMQLALDALEMCMQPDAPDTFIIASSDRDYVPLALKLRRRSVRVVGAGSEGISSSILKTVCDRYVDLSVSTPVPKANCKAEPMGSRSYEVLRRAVASYAQENSGDILLGNLVGRMKWLDSEFDFVKLGYKRFIDYLKDAEKQGVVKIVKIDTHPHVKMSQSASKSTKLLFDYSTASKAITSYQKALAAKKIDLIKLGNRIKLIDALAEQLSTSDPKAVGLTPGMMNSVVWSSARVGFPEVSRQQCHQLVHGLNLGHCFSGPNGVTYYPRMQEHRLKLGVPREQMEVRLYSFYLKLVLDADPSAKLNNGFISQWLLGKDSPEGRTLAASAIHLAKKLQACATLSEGKATKANVPQSAQK